MAYTLLVVYTLWGILQTAAGLFDSAYYRILSDPRGDTFSYYAENVEVSQTSKFSMITYLILQKKM